MYFISGCKGKSLVLHGNVIHVTEVLQMFLRWLVSDHIRLKYSI